MSVVVKLESTSFGDQAVGTGSASDVSLHLAIIVSNMDLLRRTPSRRVPGTKKEGHGDFENGVVAYAFLSLALIRINTRELV
jgi:hypothetical protein